MKLIVKNIANSNDVFSPESSTRSHATFEIQIDLSAPDSESLQPFDLYSSLHSPTTSLNCRNCVVNNKQ